jgi:transporter, major facilitator family
MREISEKKSGKLQVWLIFMCVFAYTVSYVSRYSYNANIVAIREYYGADNASAGLAGTFYFFAYGAGQVVNGLLCRRYNKKYCIAAALLISAAMNALLFFSPAFAAYKWLWLINGAALSVLWSSLVSVLAAHLSDGYLKQGVLFMSMSVAIGTCISYGTSALFMKIATFRAAFLFAAVLAGAFAACWFFVYDGLTKPLQSARNAERAEETAKTGQVGRIEADAGTRRKARVRGWDLAAVFIVPGVLAAIVNLIKDGLNTWVPEILKTSFGYGNSLSLTLTLVLPLLGMGGSALALWLHKKIGNFLILCGVIYLAETFAVAGITAILRSGNTGAAAGGATVALFGGVSLFAHSVNGALTSVAPMLLREKYESGKMAGILNGSAYVGSTISAYGLGAIADKSGWNGVFLLLLALSASATVLSFAVPALEKLWKKKGEIEAKK